MLVKVGDKVRLNDKGLNAIGGLHSWKEIEDASKEMAVVAIVDTGNKDWCGIDVSGPFNKYMLTDDCVDIIK